MSKFNQELITKARKGEIAILNDGSVEELREVLNEIWPKDDWLITGDSKYYFCNTIDDRYYSGSAATTKPAHSVKDFFMPDTKTIKGSEGGNEYIQINGGVDAEPRTYKVTRQQMKEIRDMVPQSYTAHVREFTKGYFDPFETEAQLSEKALVDIIRLFEGADQSILKSIFPDYFLIPEGEPVLVRDSDSYNWTAAISDGQGKAYMTIGSTPRDWKQIIPFTKNPPK